MIYYVSNRRPDAQVGGILSWQKPEEVMPRIKEFYAQTKVLPLDIETNDLDPYIGDVLLVAIGDDKDQFVLDATTVNIRELLPEDPDDHEWILMNGKFDAKFMIVKYDFHIVKMFDVMVAAQKIWQGYAWHPKTRPDGARFNLPSIIKRVLKMDPGMDKDTRNEFIGMSPKTAVFTYRQISYSARDVTFLPKVKVKEQELLANYGIKYLDEIGAYIPYSTALIELEGFLVPEEQWKAKIKKHKIERHEIAVKLDVEFRRLRDQLPYEQRLYLLGAAYDRIRNEQPEPLMLDLFGNPMSERQYYKLPKGKAKLGDSTANIRWGSSAEVVKIFSLLEMMLPVIRDDKTPGRFEEISEAVPLHSIVPVKKGGVKIEVHTNVGPGLAFKFTTNADNLNQMLLENPNHPGKELVRLLIRFRELSTSLNSFGLKFLEKRNPVTGRIHSIYRTDTAVTGRFQSGEKDTMYPNLQNIPADMETRTCFYPKDPKYSVFTNDLSGAEVTIMCDIAHDEQLYEWAVRQDDAHSPIATRCWKNVFLYRAGIMAGMWASPREFWPLYNSEWATSTLELYSTSNEILAKAWNKYKTFVISKTENKAMRTDFKPITFGAVYTMQDKKCAKVLNITKDEGAIVIETIRRSIPATFDYVEAGAEFALSEGYLRIENRLGQRLLFPDVIDLLKIEEPTSSIAFKKKRDIEGLARNCLIQGPQAAMLKEAIVESTLWNRANKFDAQVINPVHDELAGRCLREYDGVNGDKQVLWLSDKAKLKLNPTKPLYLPQQITPGKELDALISNQEALQVSYPEFVRLTMIEAANRYLTHYKMGSSCIVKDTWTK